jgi:hypothetical protein
MPRASYLACSPTTLERVPVKEDRNSDSLPDGYETNLSHRSRMRRGRCARHICRYYGISRSCFYKWLAY